MFDLTFGKPASNCAGVRRRDFLRVGALAGLSLPTLLRLEAEAKTANPRRKHAKRVILVYLGGGLTHHDTFDLKPDAPEEIRGKYKPVSSSVPGIQVGNLLPHLAGMMHKVALVRSGAHNNDHHETATNWVMSGRFGSAFGDFPAIGAVVAHETGLEGPMPPYVAVPRNPSFTWELGRSAYLGGKYESFKCGDPNDPNFRVQDLSPLETLPEARVQRRGSMRQAVDRLAGKLDAAEQVRTFGEFQKRAADMVLSPQARSAFAIDRETDKLRDRYGRSTFGQSCLLARRLAEHGVRFSTISYGGWDHHAKIFESCDKKLPEFDKGLSALIEDLSLRGLLDDTLVAVFGEFGRTPKINKDAGRDHWGQAASLLFAGAGVQPGLVLGATDKLGAFVTRRPVSPADVAFTILDSLGIDSRKQLLAPDGRPIEILDQGELIRELYA